MKHRNPRQRPQASGSLGALGNDLHRFHARHPAKAFTAHLLSGLLVCLVSWVGGATEPVAVFECRDHLARDWPRTLVTYEKQFPEGAMVGAFGQQVEKGIAPGRIQGVRLVDGRWIGGSYFFAAKPDTAPKVTRYTCRITEQGPLFAEAVVRYTFSQGGWYELTALVINGRTYAPGPSEDTLIFPLLPGEHRLEVRALDQPPVFRNRQASWHLYRVRQVDFMSTTTPLKRAVKAAKKAMGPCRYGIRDKALECPICGHDHFTLAAHGAYVGLLGMHTLVCAECSHVEFFVKMPPAMD